MEIEGYNPDSTNEQPQAEGSPRTEDHEMRDAPQEDQPSNTDDQHEEKSSTDAELEEVAKHLRQTDAIMHENIWSNVRRFLSLGGKPPDVIKYLSETYRGYAQMSNLICHWLRLIGADDRQIQHVIEENIKGLILQKFDPKRADQIFEEGASAPDWLEFLIKSSEWRSLIYNLSEQHNDCLLLNFAIQRISDAGHQTEIASLSSASTFFSVFNRVLRDSLEHMIDLNPIELEHSLADLAKMCNHSPHAYLYTQAVLMAISSEKNGRHLKRVSQELERAMINKDPLVRRIGFILTNISRNNDVNNSIVSMLTANACNPADINRLHTAYSESNPPPVEYIRNIGLLDILIAETFDIDKTIDVSYRSQCFYLLAYATTVQDDRSITVPDYDTNFEVDKSELDNVVHALETAQSICIKNYFGTELQAVVETLRETLMYPVVTMGVLYWIAMNVNEPDRCAASFNTKSIPSYVILIQEIASLHPFQQSRVLDILVQCFELDSDLDPLSALDLRKTLLDVMLYLMEVGHVMPVINRIRKWSSKIDQSLLRHVIGRLLDSFAPPFSDEFVAEFQPIVKLVNTDAFKNNAEHMSTINIILGTSK
jgi:negative elongation factor C/D